MLPIIKTNSLLSAATRLADGSAADYIVFRFFSAIDKVHQRDLQILEEESRARIVDRCRILKEEIMIKAWSPARVERMLLLGYDVEDM